MPDFSQRNTDPELMDDRSITDWRLTRALDELSAVNHWLGGDRNSVAALGRLLPAGPVRVLDVGSGGGDFIAALLRSERGRRGQVEAVGVDFNPATVTYARQRFAARIPSGARAPRFLEADACRLPFPDAHFDVAHAGLFLHHFDDEDAVTVLCEMRRVARCVVVNDLHRHAVAYWSIRALARLLARSPMFRADAPHSVLRGFRRAELLDLARQAGLEPTVAWRWAFRWILVAC